MASIYDMQTPQSSHQAAVARGKGTCCITELTHISMPFLWEDGVGTKGQQSTVSDHVSEVLNNLEQHDKVL